jgi:hypothetical protein
LQEVIMLELIPIPPDTIASGKEEIQEFIETELRKAGVNHLLSDNHISIQIEQTFPTDQAIVVGITLLSGIALETFKTIVLPALKRKFEVKQRTQRSKKTRKTRRTNPK